MKELDKLISVLSSYEHQGRVVVSLEQLRRFRQYPNAYDVRPVILDGNRTRKPFEGTISGRISSMTPTFTQEPKSKENEM